MQNQKSFHTDIKYTNRKSKAEYIYRKYKAVLSGKILDVGADDCYLKEHLSDGASYWGIGLGGNPDQTVDLEKEGLPFPDRNYDCVLCCDVLEHLENIHEVFDELCRVSLRYVIISLPNPWASFYRFVRYGNYKADVTMKYYCLPVDKPSDRHKWFFGYQEAVRFIQYRAQKNDFSILQMDHEGSINFISLLLARFISGIFVSKDFDIRTLCYGSIWAILERRNNLLYLIDQRS